MTIEDESRVAATIKHVPIEGEPPPVPPGPTFDFSVPTITAKAIRSWESDTDFATLAITTLAADGTQLTKFGPVSMALNEVVPGQTYGVDLSLTGIDVPDGGSVAFVFMVLNKGAWAGLSTALNSVDLIGSGVVGALAQGQIAAAAGPTTVALPYVVLAVAGIVAVLEGLDVLLADCDGVVVPGLMTIGKTELLANAVASPWDTTVDYPGTDSPDGCGGNSDYSVNYRFEATPPPVPTVVMPQLIGLTPAEAKTALEKVGLANTEDTVSGTVDKPPICVGQQPVAGTAVPIRGVAVVYKVEVYSPARPPSLGTSKGSGQR